MAKIALSILALICLIPSVVRGQETLRFPRTNKGYEVEISVGGKTLLTSPAEGLWSIATGWEDRWMTDWYHASPDSLHRSGPWTILTGRMSLPQGTWKLRDAYKTVDGRIKVIRRFMWTGDDTLRTVTLSIRWVTTGDRAEAFLPGILYYGNPSGEHNRPAWVPHYDGASGQQAIFEETRYPMPFASLEWRSGGRYYGAALHTLPSPAVEGAREDLWWSLGVQETQQGSELISLSGPVTYHGKKSVAKALQSRALPYGHTYLNIAPGTTIEKTFYLEAYPASTQGRGFQQPVHTSLDIFEPYSPFGLPDYRTILNAKYRFAQRRWIEGDDYAGFNMYSPDNKERIVVGWAGQAAAPGYALQRLRFLDADEQINEYVQRSLNFITSAPVTEAGYPVRYNPETGEWSDRNLLSQAQGMYHIAKAIQAGRENPSLNTQPWEAFLRKVADVHAGRILQGGWQPRSTAQAFFIAPLVLSYELFGDDPYRRAALKAARYYADRHLSMEEPYWGGTLDAQGEDKEGAWAAFQGFLAVYEMTGDPQYLNWAHHAMDVVLSYVVVWDIPMPPGRLADHRFKTHGWTVVSPQNQHLDVYGVLFAPEIYRMGELLGKAPLKRLARVMFRSAAQLIDPYGSQGEQIQHTNFAQRGDRSAVENLRGGYSEGWTVFWITAHFLTAAAKFEEMDVSFRSDLSSRSRSSVADP